MTRPITLRTRGAGSYRTVDCVHEARQAVARERCIIRAEADAFEALRERLQSIDSDLDVAGSGEPARTVVGAIETRNRSTESARAAIREAYAETVMDTPHYAEEYGESFWENLAAEFGAELAAALREASALTPLLKSRLLAAAREAEARREELLSELEREAAALETASEELHGVCEDLGVVRSRPFYDCTPTELRKLLEDLAYLDDRCRELAARRQSGDLEPGSGRPRSSGDDGLNDYVYHSRPFTYPVLKAVATVSEGIERTRRRIEEILSARADA